MSMFKLIKTGVTKIIKMAEDENSSQKINALLNKAKSTANKFIDTSQNQIQPTQTQSANSFCIFCGTKLNVGAHFCSGCGKQVEK